MATEQEPRPEELALDAPARASQAIENARQLCKKAADAQETARSVIQDSERLRERLERHP